MEFIFYDPMAFCDVFRRLHGDFTEIQSSITDMFGDWRNIDLKREERSARRIAQKMLERVYSPDRKFYVHQTRHTWATLRDTL